MDGSVVKKLEIALSQSLFAYMSVTVGGDRYNDRVL
jgi:hypothetical protein